MGSNVAEQSCQALSAALGAGGARWHLARLPPKNTCESQPQRGRTTRGLRFGRGWAEGRARTWGRRDALRQRRSISSGCRVRLDSPTGGRPLRSAVRRGRVLGQLEELNTEKAGTRCASANARSSACVAARHGAAEKARGVMPAKDRRRVERCTMPRAIRRNGRLKPTATGVLSGAEHDRFSTHSTSSNRESR